YPEDVWINDTLARFSLREVRPPRYEDALRYYTAASALRPRMPRWHQAIASVLAAQGAAAEAIAEGSRAIQLAPKDPETWIARGDVKIDLQQYDSAVEDYSKAIALDPKNVTAHINRGVALAERGLPDKARTDYLEAILL